MDIKARYTLADFDNYPSANESLGLALISHANFCAFEKKSFVDENGVQQRRKMVRVGPYFLGDGLKEVWALATGLSIKYYYGYAHAHQLAQGEDRYRPRIYYRGTNFRFIAAHESDTSERVRAYGRLLVEIFINYVFLAGRELGYVKNGNRTDMLADFAQACINYPERKGQEEDEELCKREEIEQNEEDQARFRRNNFNRLGKERISRIKTELSDDSNRIKAAFRRDSSVLVHRRANRDNLHAELEREREVHVKFERISRSEAAKLKAEWLRSQHGERSFKKKLERSKQKSLRKSEALLKAKQALQSVLDQEGQDESSQESAESEVDQGVEEDQYDSSHNNVDDEMYRDDEEDDDYGDGSVEAKRPRNVARASRRHAYAFMSNDGFSP